MPNMPGYFLAVFVFIASPAASRAGKNSLVDSFRLLAEGKVAAALRHLTASEARADVIAGRAWLQAGNIDRAQRAFSRALSRPQAAAPLKTQALFGLAECRARRRQFARAERLFRQALEKVLSPRQRRQLAERLRLLAEEKLAPPHRQQADPAAAEEFLRAALELVSAGRLADSINLLIGTALANQGHHQAAAAWLLKFATRHRDSPQAGQALLQASRSLLAAGDRRAARRTLEQLLARRPPPSLAEEATFLLSRSYGFPRPKTGQDLYSGLAVCRKFLRLFPKSRRAAQVRLEMALAPLVAGHPALASASLRQYLDSADPTADRANASFQLAMSLLGQLHYRRARKAFRDFIARFPQDQNWLEARKRVREIDWALAERARRNKKFTSAAKLFEKFAGDYPSAERATEALLRAVDCLEESDQRSRAEQLLDKITSRYHRSQEACHAWYRLGIYAEQRQDFRAARRDFQKSADCNEVDIPAQARLEALDKPTLHVAASQVIRTSHQPRLTVQVRNIERLSVDVYPVDSEDFFRDRLGMKQVIDLDIALCRPERSQEIAVKSYRPHRLIEQKLTLPLRRPGLYLVNVRGGGLEAATAVRFSDLDIAVRQSGNQLFVFAQDLRRVRPWEGVELLVADEKHVVFSGRTGARGTWQTALGEEQDGKQLQVLALAGRHVAWLTAPSRTWQLLPRTQARAVLIPARPAYRPGERIQLAGFVRDRRSHAGGLSFRPGDEFVIEARDPQGLVLERRRVVLDDYGMFSAEFTLAGDSPPGPYGFNLLRAGKSLASTNVQVGLLRLPPFRLEIVLDNKVLTRGQAITGTVLVRHPAGAAVVDQQVRLGLEGTSRWQESRSDSHGRVRFSLPTTGLATSGQLALVVRLPRHNLEARAAVLVAARDFSIKLRLPDRWRAGQPGDVNLRLVGVDGTLHSGRVELEVVRREGEGLVPVLRKTIAVGSGGQALAVTPPGPGRYLFRALATDNRGNPVFTEASLAVEDGGESPLVLDVERSRLAPGQALRVRIDSRRERALALLTAETDRVLSYRVVRLQQGGNRVEFAAPAGVSEFNLWLTAMHGTRHSAAERRIRVDHRLRLQVRTDRPEYGPGDEVALTVSASDAAGRPADVNMVLAVVDNKLFAAYPERVPDLLETFLPRQELMVFDLRCSNGQIFPAVDGWTPEQPEVIEAEGSAAMAALSRQRRALTEQAAQRFGKMAKVAARAEGAVGNAYGGGGLGLAGHGAGGGSAAVHQGQFRLAGRGFLRRFFALTAAFFPRLRTGPDGVATLRFRLPHSLTSWRIAGRALGRRVGAGEYFGDITVTAPLWVELVAPPGLTNGDGWRPGARLFNNSRRVRHAQVRLSAAGRSFTRQVKLPALAQTEIFFPEIKVPENLAGKEQVVELAVDSDDLHDRLRRGVPVAPAGFEQRLAFAGMLAGNRRLELPVPAEWSRPRLQLHLDSGHQGLMLIDRLDPLLFGGRPEQALLLEELWQASGTTAPAAQRRLVAERLRRALLRMCRLQKSDGTFSWSPRGPSAILATARAVRALARARSLAPRIDWLFPTEKFQRALQALGRQLSTLDPRRHRLRAEVLYSLGRAKPGLVPPLMLDRLQRLRGQLPLAAQAWLGLTWHELKRPEKAAELARLVRRRLANHRPPAVLADSRTGLSPTGGLARALQLLAVVEPHQPWPPQAAEWLLVSAAEGVIEPGLAAATAAALAARLTSALRAGPAGLSVLLDGRPLAELTLGRHAARQRPPLEFGPEKLTPGKHTLELRLRGPGSLPYLVMLSGHRRRAPQAAPGAGPRLRRVLEPVPAPYRGRDITAGFSVAAPGSKRWERPVERLPAGRQLQVTVHIDRAAGRHGGPLILEDNIPSGLVLVPGSQTGNFIYRGRRGRQLVFVLPAGKGRRSIGYRLRALNPGRFHFQPAQLRGYFAPGERAYLPAVAFSVDEATAAPPAVRPTPDELFQRGRAAAEQGDWQQVITQLEKLYNEIPLREKITHQVLSDLLLAAISSGDAERMVRYFELAKEKNPDLVVSFDKIPPLQDAYRRLGAFEAGLRLARGVADATLLSELHVIGVLEGNNELAEALDLFRRQLDTFPASDALAQALYSFSQVIYDRADRAREKGPPSGFDRAGLLDEVIDLQARFAATFPGHADFPAAVYSLAAAQLERGRPAAAAAWCNAGLVREPENELADELAYLRAFATFRSGDFDRALELCRQVQKQSDNETSREMATYIMAQIYHARGQLQKALPLYRAVRDRFRDAAETLVEMNSQSLRVDRVVRVSGSRPVLALHSRNIDSINLRAFRIDPLRLLRGKKHLADMEDVNLSGIRPVVSRHLKINNTPLVTRQTDLVLPLRQRGAYLVILRGGDQVASSLVLVEGLQLQLSPVSGGGRLRLQVRSSSGAPAAGARVQVLADAGERLVVGRADLRGVFTTDGVSGPVTAAAELNGAYGMLLPAPTAEGKRSGSGENLQELEFDEDNIGGQLSRPGKGNQPERSRKFFQQKVKGVSARQAM